MKTNQLFKKLIFTNEEVLSDFKSRSKAYYWLSSSCKRNDIKMIRNGLYASIDPASGFPYVSKFMVASKINKSSYVAYHSALEFHGLANQVYNNIYVASKERFKTFQFFDIVYEHVKANFIEGVKTYESSSYIKVSDLERTLIDCIDNILLAGGIDELLYALDFVEYVDENKLLKYLKLYNKKSLYQKAGYLFEQYQEEFNISDEFFDECKKHIGKKCIYFLNYTSIYRKGVYLSRWNIIAPRTVREDYLEKNINERNLQS